MLSRKKLLSIAQPDGAQTLGLVATEGIIDVRAASLLTGIDAPLTLEQALRDAGADAALDRISAAVPALAPAQRSQVLRSSEQIEYGRLFVNPGKILCIGLNYRQHAQELGATIPERPVLFNKLSNTLAAHNSTIELPARELAYQFDYETELLLVIGRHARHVAPEQALDYLAGYCTANDLSARDLQFGAGGGQWLLGKTLDQFAPIGPYFVSADLVRDPNRLKIETRVNGELRQSSSTADFIFNTQQIIAYLSTYFALEPGDIIFTGTPEGVISGYPEDQRQWLKAGDKIVSSVEGLGELHFQLA